MSLLGCEPTDVSAFGATYLTAGVVDIKVTNRTGRPSGPHRA